MTGDMQVTVTFEALEHALAVTTTGAGVGSVVSTPAGIDCGGTCDASFAAGSTVTLTATPDTSSAFAGWSGDCAGEGACAPVLAADRVVTATFLDKGGKLDWLTQLGDSDGVYSVIGNGVALDAAGNVLTTGQAAGTVDFGAGPTVAPLPSAGTAYLAKYSPVGGHLWSKRVYCGEPLGAFAEGRKVAVDAVGGVIVLGDAWGTCDLGGASISTAGDYDGLLFKLDGATGDYVWSRTIGGTTMDYAYGLAVDAVGDVIASGNASGTVDFGSGPIDLPQGSVPYVAKFSGVDGSHLWTKTFEPSGGGTAYAVAVDAAGSVFVGGEFNEFIDFGAGSVDGATQDAFVAKYSAQGDLLWAMPFGGDQQDGVNALAVDAFGDVFATGMFTGTVTMGQTTWSSAGEIDIFLVKLAGSNGKPLWSRTMGGLTEEQAWGLAVDSNGDVGLTGFFIDTVDFGGGALTALIGDAFVAKYEGSEGQHIWSRRYGGGVAFGWGIASDPTTDRWAVTGQFVDSVDFGGVTLTPLGYNDAFLAVLQP